jgi:hypothetical protein
MNQNNKKTPWIPILIITVAVLALGYFLFKSSPQNSNSQANTDMHGHSGTGTTDSSVLNALIDKPMPDIKLADKDGKTYTGDSFKGKNTVLFFSEGLMCYPACWNQIASFGADQRFNTDQVQAVSVVVDSPSDWQKALSKMPDLAKSATLFDAGGNASRQLRLLSLFVLHRPDIIESICLITQGPRSSLIHLRVYLPRYRLQFIYRIKYNWL